MFRLVKQVFIALLNFSGSLGSMANVSDFAACISLNNSHAWLDLLLLI